MTARQIKTVQVQAKEWFDKVNGNSYFSMNITVNYGLKNEWSIYVPMQYGYGDHYMHQAYETIKKELGCFRAVDSRDSYWRAYERYNIKSIHSKRESLKRDL